MNVHSNRNTCPKRKRGNACAEYAEILEKTTIQDINMKQYEEQEEDTTSDEGEAPRQDTIRLKKGEKQQEEELQNEQKRVNKQQEEHITWLKNIHDLSKNTKGNYLIK